jgi:hypothetical protein
MSQSPDDLQTGASAPSAGSMVRLSGGRIGPNNTVFLGSIAFSPQRRRSAVSWPARSS